MIEVRWNWEISGVWGIGGARILNEEMRIQKKVNFSSFFNRMIGFVFPEIWAGRGKSYIVIRMAFPRLLHGFTTALLRLFHGFMIMYDPYLISLVLEIWIFQFLYPADFRMEEYVIGFSVKIRKRWCERCHPRHPFRN